MGKLLVYLKDYKKESVLGPLFKLLEASFELIVPLVMAAIIDHGVADGDKPYIMKMCLVLVLLAVIGLTCSITAQYFAAKAAVGFSTGLRHALFEHIQKLSFSEMDTVGTSTLITRMTSDINQTQNGVNLVLRLFLRSPFIVFGAMIMAFTIDVKAALVFVVTIPLLSIVVFGIMLVSIPLYKKVQSALDKVLGITRENLTGSRVIRAFNKENDEITNFNESNDALTKIQLYVGKISALMNPLTYVIINGAVVVLVWTGAIRVNSGYITQGEVVALVNYMSQILVELIKLANLIININKSIACGNRIQAIFELQPSITDHAVTPMAEEKTEHSGEVPEVVFSHVGLTYAGAGEESLTDIDFTVKKGETVGIIGGTGSGKSSIINMLHRFYDTTEGSVRLDGVDIRKISLRQLRRSVAVVLQDVFLFSDTIEENIKMGNRSTMQMDEIKSAAASAQASSFIEKMDEQYETVIGERGVGLSGGQKQRISIARALSKHSPILVMDDSTSALDMETEHEIQKTLNSLKDTTKIIIAHRISAVCHADEIIYLQDGRIAERGTHEELLAKKGLYYDTYMAQYGGYLAS